VFGFSRGAYTARALTGMLRTVGLLHADADNLVPYALKLYVKSGPSNDPGSTPGLELAEAEREFWRLREDFRNTLATRPFPTRFSTRSRFASWDCGTRSSQSAG
jgi:uncharacterized protein (DUF2235 family)